MSVLTDVGWWVEILPRYGKYRFTHLIVFLGAELDERRVHFLVDRTTHDFPRYSTESWF